MPVTPAMGSSAHRRILESCYPAFLARKQTSGSVRGWWRVTEDQQLACTCACMSEHICTCMHTCTQCSTHMISHTQSYTLAHTPAHVYIHTHTCSEPSFLWSCTVLKGPRHLAVKKCLTVQIRCHCHQDTLITLSSITFFFFYFFCQRHNRHHLGARELDAMLVP